MSKDNMIKSMLPDQVNMTPNGFVADLLRPDQFAECYELFFDEIFKVSDIKGNNGLQKVYESLWKRIVFL